MKYRNHEICSAMVDRVKFSGVNGSKKNGIETARFCVVDQQLEHLFGIFIGSIFTNKVVGREIHDFLILHLQKRESDS